MEFKSKWGIGIEIDDSGQFFFPGLCLKGAQKNGVVARMGSREGFRSVPRTFVY